MDAFASLFQQIDQTGSTNEKVARMAEFFRREDPETCAWALFFLSGRKPKQLIGAAKLRQWAKDAVGYPEWLMDECYGTVGDTAEMIALILSAGPSRRGQPVVRPEPVSLGHWMTHRLLPLNGTEDDIRRRRILEWWETLDSHQIFLLNKLLTGSLRIGVSQVLVYRALSDALAVPRSVLAARLVGDWWPTAEFFCRLGVPRAPEEDASPESSSSLLPVPFCLAAPLDEGSLTALGALADWQVEWKWDGVRCQVVKAGERLEIWSRGEDRITPAFPDLAAALLTLPGDWVLDGEVVPGTWRRPGSFQALQKRLNRKQPPLALVAAHPVSFLAYDLLRWNDAVWADRALYLRRAALEDLLAPPLHDGVGLSPTLRLESWEEAERLRLAARQQGAEGLMLKHRGMPYEAGRKRGIWFKWKADPYTVDAVLTAAQPGSGRRASLYTDYTFSVWKDGFLVPLAKAYSGLSDSEIRSLDSWIRRHTTERFGPVRSVEPVRVFELGFEGISRSDRHKSGYAVRFPRILRERSDKRPADANRIGDLEALLRLVHPTAGGADDQSSSVKRQTAPEQMSLMLDDRGAT